MSVTLSCGCEGEPGEEGVDVFSLGESWGGLAGFHPALSYHHTCQRCATKWVSDGWATLDREAAEAAFDAACQQLRQKRAPSPSSEQT